MAGTDQRCAAGSQLLIPHARRATIPPATDSACPIAHKDTAAAWQIRFTNEIIGTSTVENSGLCSTAHG